MPVALPPELFLLIPAFLAFWVGIHWVMSRSGWHQLARYFRADPAGLPAAETFWPYLAWIRHEGNFIPSTEYRSMLRVGCSPAGLGLAVWLPYRVGHPALLIPWSAVSPVQRLEGLFGPGGYSVVIALPDGAGSVQITLASNTIAAQIAGQVESFRNGQPARR